MLIVMFDPADVRLSSRQAGTLGQFDLRNVGRSSRLADRLAVEFIWSHGFPLGCV